MYTCAHVHEFHKHGHYRKNTSYYLAWLYACIYSCKNILHAHCICVDIYIYIYLYRHTCMRDNM